MMGGGKIKGRTKRLMAPQLRVAMPLAAMLVGGCAPTASLFDALETKYSGFEELSPKLSPGRAGASFPYTPGTILPAVAVAGDRNQRTWVATTDVRCGPDARLSSLKYWQRADYRYRYGNGQITGGDAKAWVSAKSGLASGAVAAISDVVVSVNAVRSYEPRARALAALNTSAANGCVLPAGLGDGGIRRVRAVIIGDLRVRLYFEQGVDLIARAQITNQLSAALGFGFQRISEDEIAGTNIAFGVKWQ